MRRLFLLLALLTATPAPGGTLEGRLVTMNVLTWDDPAAPLFESEGVTVKVGQGVEFGMGPEGHALGFDVVPVQVEITPGRIELSYPEAQGNFWPAAFNGYVLQFKGDCLVFTEARIDRAETTMPIRPEAVYRSGNALYINVSGLDYGPKAKLALDLAVTDCPIS
ncbi:MAG: hypothetical protein JNJ84_12945 [Rhodobacteraceae bacterium]|nr:hypothetical protein [Paracoccaceae bacterium]